MVFSKKYPILPLKPDLCSRWATELKAHLQAQDNKEKCPKILKDQSIWSVSLLHYLSI